MITKADVEQLEKNFFKRGNPLTKLLKITLDLLGAQQVGVLFGTDDTKVKFLPTSDWDRGVADMFDGRGSKGILLKLFGSTIVTFKKLSPIYFYKKGLNGQHIDNDGVINYMLRNCADYYKEGISIIFSPDISGNIYRVSDHYAEIPFHSYDGIKFSEPDIKVRMDLEIIRHFNAKNYISIYIPDYGILVVNTADPSLMELGGSGFVRQDELKEKFDILIRLVETASLAALGQLKGRRGAQLLWKKETQLRKTSLDLIENEKKYRDLYENAPIAYFSMGIDGNILKCNNNTLKLSGYEKSELIGMNLMELWVNEKGKTLTPNQVKTMLDQGRPVRDIEMKFKNKYQLDTWASISLEAVRNQQGKIIEIRVMAIDISERKSLETQLLNSQKMEAIGTLAGGIAHDFNNILSPISGYSEMLLMDMEDSKKKDHIKIIHDCAQYAQGLVDQILTFSKQKESEFKLVKPHLIVQEALALTKSFLPATIEIKKKIDEECGLIMVDQIQVHQVAMNLISNAYQAMEEKGGVLEVSLEEVNLGEDTQMFSLNSGEYILLKITDTGPGMPPEVIERIFDPFFTTKKEGKGTGIGLSLAHGIIQSHRGYINVVSEKGKGTCFEVYLPVCEGDLQLADQAENKGNDDSRPIERGNENILLVDDDKKVAFMVQHLLEKLGYTVTCFLDSPSALKSFSESCDNFDLVITDLTMPDLTGYQLAEEIIKISPEMPIILCTGLGEHVDKNRHTISGIKGIMNKPVSVTGLSNLIRDILGRPED